jgi:hypothetical protein
MKIIRYTDVSGDTPTKLSIAVEEWMKNGWQPFGSPYIWNKTIFQTIVKYEE